MHQEQTPIRYAEVERLLQYQTPQLDINHNWLAQYETRPDSIFKYYSLENEVGFLKDIKNVPEKEKKYYLEENVKRFLGEFIGKVPYTTIPYSLRPGGFQYAGIPIMDSYKKAASGGPREQAEIEGFGKIEKKFANSKRDEKTLPTAIWISPPKIADYGFVFVLAPQLNGMIKEYVLRYEEKRGDLKRSREIASQIDPYTLFSFKSTDDFIKNPSFVYNDLSDETLQALLKTVGISQNKINVSLRFEREIEGRLSSWINAYSNSLLALSETTSSPLDYFNKLQQSKAILLSIYSCAQRIKDEILAQPYPQTKLQKRPFEVDQIGYALTNIQQNSPVITEGGSCPAVEIKKTFPWDHQSFVSNSDFMSFLIKKTPLETKVTEEKSKSFPCPKCHQPIPSGEGKTACPHCGITKEQYAKEIGGQTCA